MLQFCNMKHNIARYLLEAPGLPNQKLLWSEAVPARLLFFLTWCAEHSPGILLLAWIADFKSMSCLFCYQSCNTSWDGSMVTMTEGAVITYN